MSFSKSLLTRNPFDTRYKVIRRHWSKVQNHLTTASEAYKRMSVVRFDLHIPLKNLDVDCPNYASSKVISKFMDSLVAHLKTSSFKAHGQKQYLYYVWTKEIGPKSSKPHYHVCLFLNKDDFGILGCSMRLLGRSLRDKIELAWASALDIDWAESSNNVYFGKRPVHWLVQKDQNYHEELQNVCRRLAYLVKPEGKVNDGSKRKSFVKGKRLIFIPKKKFQKS